MQELNESASQKLGQVGLSVTQDEEKVVIDFLRDERASADIQSDQPDDL